MGTASQREAPVAGQGAASEVEGRWPSRHLPIRARRLLGEVGDTVTPEKVMCLRKIVINAAVVLVGIELLGKTRCEVVSYITGSTKIRRRQKAEQLDHGGIRDG